jgi:predicted aspartyl protease
MKFAYSEQYLPVAPVLPIRLAYPDENFTIGPLTALVDTGADGCLIPQYYLDQISAPLVDQVRIRSHWGEWRLVQVYTVDIGLEDMRFPVVEAAGDPGDGIILGRNFLNRLRITLDGPGSQLMIITGKH